MRNPPRESRLHACSPVHFLLSPFCRRSRPAGPANYAVACRETMIHHRGRRSPFGGVTLFMRKGARAANHNVPLPCSMPVTASTIALIRSGWYSAGKAANAVAAA